MSGLKKKKKKKAKKPCSILSDIQRIEVPKIVWRWKVTLCRALQYLFVHSVSMNIMKTILEIQTQPHYFFNFLFFLFRKLFHIVQVQIHINHIKLGTCWQNSSVCAGDRASFPIAAGELLLSLSVGAAGTQWSSKLGCFYFTEWKRIYMLEVLAGTEVL